MQPVLDLIEHFNTSIRFVSVILTEQVASTGHFKAVPNERTKAERRQSPESQPKIAMNHMTTFRWSLADEVVHYPEAGISAIGIWRSKLFNFGEERALELIRDTGIAVSSVSWAGGFTGANGHSYRESVRDAREAIRLSAQMNAGCLNILSGPRAGHTTNHARKLLLQGLRELSDYAAEQGVTLALQPMHRVFAPDWTFLHGIDETLDVLDRLDHPFVRMAFDICHLSDEPGLLGKIRHIAPYVALVQLGDCVSRPTRQGDRCRLSEGSLPLQDMIAAFVQFGYQGFFEVQIWSDQVWSSEYVDLLQSSRATFDGLCCE